MKDSKEEVVVNVTLKVPLGLYNQLFYVAKVLGESRNNVGVDALEKGLKVIEQEIPEEITGKEVKHHGRSEKSNR